MPMTMTASDRMTAGFINLTKLKWVSVFMISIVFSSNLNADLLNLPIPDEVVKDDPRDDNRGEHADRDADGQRDGETLDRTRAEAEEEQRRDKGRHIGVENGQKGLRIT